MRLPVFLKDQNYYQSKERRNLLVGLLIIIGGLISIILRNQ